MTVWAEVPAMLAVTPDDALDRMKAVCKAHYRKYKHGPENEREDAQKMFDMIKAEQRRRLLAPARTALIQ
jgi:hypothetical protein